MPEFDFDLATCAVLVLVTMLQSLFGVGVLLFGTPLLLLLGREFADVLALLLPVSVAISLTQALGSRGDVDRAFLRRVFILALPGIALGLGLALHAQLALGLPVAGVLLLCGLRGLWASFDRGLARVLRHERTALVLTGLVHGISNLGGSLLTVIVHQKRLSKEASRATIAAAYALFATSQIVTLLVGHRGAAADIVGNLPYVGMGLCVYGLTNVLVYRRLDAQRYGQAFASFLVICGVTIAWRSW